MNLQLHSASINYYNSSNNEYFRFFKNTVEKLKKLKLKQNEKTYFLNV